MNKTKLLMNIFIALAIVIGILLSSLIKRNVIINHEEYYIPFNIGVHWITLLGMAAIILFQSALYTATMCDEKYFYDVMICGIWFADLIVLPEIVSSNETYFYLRLRDGIGIDLGFDYYIIWDVLEYILYFAFILILIRYLYIWISGKRKRRNNINLFTISKCIVGSCYLILRSYTNEWFILLVIGTIAFSWPVLRLTKGMWMKLDVYNK